MAEDNTDISREETAEMLAAAYVEASFRHNGEALAKVLAPDAVVTMYPYTAPSAGEHFPKEILSRSELKHGMEEQEKADHATNKEVKINSFKLNGHLASMDVIYKFDDPATHETGNEVRSFINLNFKKRGMNEAPPIRQIAEVEQYIFPLSKTEAARNFKLA